jgi:hypothetical protein
VETGPQNLLGVSEVLSSTRKARHLMTKLIIAALKLCIWDPDRATRMHVPHSAVDVGPEFGATIVCAIAEGANPELAGQAVLYAIDGVLQAAVAMTVRGKVVGFDIAVGIGMGTSDGGIPRSGGGPGFLALNTNGMWVWTGCLDLERDTKGHVDEGVGEGMVSGG